MAVRAHERLDHRLSEFVFRVEDVIRDGEAARDRASVVHGLGRATAPESAHGIVRFLPRPHPQRDPDDVVALLDEQCRRHGRVDAAAHPDDDPLRHTAQYRAPSNPATRSRSSALV